MYELQEEEEEGEEKSPLFVRYSDNETKIRVAEAESEARKAEARKAEARKAEAEAVAEAEASKAEVRKIEDKYTTILMDKDSSPHQIALAKNYLKLNDSWTDFFDGLGCFIFSFIFIA